MSEKKYKLSMLVYDGINFFKDGEWTLLEFPSVEEGKHTIGFLETLSNEQIDHWIRVQTYFKESKRSFEMLKYNKSYSGETTNHAPLLKDIWKDTPDEGPECIQAINWFDVQWSNCPVEVEEEVKRLWQDNELGNDDYFYVWDGDGVNGDDNDDNVAYPIIHAYLKSRGITECHIHWWW